VTGLMRGQKALQQLLSAEKIQRIGKGISGNPFPYFEKAR